MIGMTVVGADAAAASLVNVGPKAHAAAYGVTKKFGAVLKARVNAQAPTGTNYRKSVRLKTTGATGNPRATVSRPLNARRGRGNRPGFLKVALKETAPEYVAAISAAVATSLD